MTCTCATHRTEAKPAMIVHFVNKLNGLPIRTIRLASAEQLLDFATQAVAQGWNVRIHVRPVEN